MTPTPALVLGLHPSYRGLGWVLFEGPDAPFDWGTSEIRRANDARALLRAAALLDKFQPAVLVLEDFERGRRAPRIRILGRAIVSHAELRNVAVHCFDRSQIRAILHPARSRHAIAAAVAVRIRQLAPYLPKKRKPWETERLNLALFSAAACAVTYYAHAA